MPVGKIKTSAYCGQNFNSVSKSRINRIANTIRTEYRETVKATEHVLTKMLFPNSILPDLNISTLKTFNNKSANINFKYFSRSLTTGIYKEIDSSPFLQNTINFASKKSHYIGLAIDLTCELVLRPIHIFTGYNFGILQSNLADVGIAMFSMGLLANSNKTVKGRVSPYLEMFTLWSIVECLSLNDTYLNIMKDLNVKVGTVFDYKDIIAYFIGVMSCLIIDKLAIRLNTSSKVNPILKTPIDKVSYQISNSISAGEKLVFSGGKLFRKNDGKLISDDPILNIGKDMGEITARRPLETFKGMKRFFKEIYLKPEKWGIIISNEFTDDQKTDIQTQLTFLNNKLGIELDNSMSLFIAPKSLKKPFLPTGYQFRYRFDELERSSYKGYLNISKQDILSNALSKEYIYFLKDIGEIKNDIIIDSYDFLKEFESNKYIKGNGLGAKKCFMKGLSSDPYKLITEKPHFSFLTKNEKKYRKSAILAGLAVQLSEKLNDPEAKWEFLNVIARSNQEELLPNLLNSKFKQFFEEPLNN